MRARSAKCPRIAHILTVICLPNVPAWAEEPVYFADAELKAAVEQALFITDPTPTDMLGLTELYCTRGWYSEDKPITSLTGLEHAANLQTLHVRLNELGDISALSGLDNLETLDLSQNQISDLSSLAGLDNLHDLNLHGNQISDIAPLAGLTSLVTLSLRLNQVSDISALSAATDLTSLDISHNAVSDLSPLSSLTALSTLIAWYNQISDVSAVSGLTSLHKLDLGGNQIREISALAGLSHMSDLNLETNLIQDISPLCGLTSLSRLALENNRLNREAYETHIPLIIANNPGIYITHDAHTGRLLRVSSTAGGAVLDPGEGEFTYDYGEFVHLEAAANPGFVFVGWQGTCVTAQNPVVLEMDEDQRMQATFRSLLDVLHVDDDAPGDPNPRDPGASDAVEDGTPEHPFDRIQEAIEVAGRAVTIIVHPGTYSENIDFLSKDIRLMGSDPADAEKGSWPTIKGAGNGPVVRFGGGVGPDCLLAGFVITNGHGDLAGGIDCSYASPTITNCLIVGSRATDPNGATVYLQNSRVVLTNCTIAHNRAGRHGAALVLMDSDVTMVDSILWGNTPGQIRVQGVSEPFIRYCDVQGWWADYGNIHVDPLFAREGTWVNPDNPEEVLGPEDAQAVWRDGDYHLRSRAGRWDPISRSWSVDDLTSPCIDAGSPSSDIGCEPLPNGGIVNMGAYGGTAEASKSP